MIKKALAFTLSEVLITMSIVGVVAAMTIPTLHYQKTKKEYSTKLKNFFSKMDNALLEMQVDKGSFRDMQKPPTGDLVKGWTWYMNNVDPYMGHDYIKTGDQEAYFKDGSSVKLVTNGGCLDLKYDVNGKKRPNTYGKDQYLFLFCFTPDQRRHYFNSDEVFFGTYGDGMHSMPRGNKNAGMIKQCLNTPYRCSKLLLNDQWEFKDDYPFKF